MEKLQQIQQTLREIDDRTPDALRVAFNLGRRVSPAPAPGEEDRVATFVASVLPPPPPPPVSEDADVKEPGELHEAPLASTSEDDATRVLRMEWASCYVPDHDEDAHFGHDEAGVLGVADGVGGYRTHGVDAGAFSRGLMTTAFMHVLAIEPGTPVCPYTLLEWAYEETAATAASGASTAVILSLSGATLKWAYIGDSAFSVLRGGKIVHRSRPQQRHFNCPFQLNSRGDGTSVTEADVGEVPVRDGDVVVVGTDGLFDNVFDAELERVVRMGAAQGYSPKNMADVVAGITYEMSRTRKKESPFSTEYQKHPAGVGFHGGKPDDITVVVAFIRAMVKETSRASWSHSYERGLAEILVEHNVPVYRGQNGWVAEGCKRIASKFNIKFPSAQFTKQQIQEKEKDMKANYKAVRDARKQSGTGWDASLNMIIAEPIIWEKLKKDYPRVKRYERKPFLLFPVLASLYEGEDASSTT
ncbi:hypothetical protein ACQ4PT_054237 [Festuca glaucescens]